MKSILLLCAAIAASLPFATAIAQDAPSAPAAAAASTSPPPVEAFARLPFMESPRLSPDGKRVAARLAIQGKLRLAIIPLDDVSKVKLIDPGNLDLTGWEWVNNDWLVVTTGQLQPVEGDRWYVRRALSIRADGSKIIALTAPKIGQNADDILWYARDGRPHVLLAMQTSIYSNDVGIWPEVRDFDVSTGKSVLVQGSIGYVNSWYADTAGTVRLGIGYYDERRSYRAMYRPTASASWRTIDRARGINASLSTLPALMLPQSGKAVAVDDKDGFDAVYDFDLDTMKVGEKVFGAPGYDVDTPMLDPTGTHLLGFRYTDTRPETKWLDPKLEQIQTDIDKVIPGLAPQIVSWSDDLSTLLVTVGGPDRAGAYYIYRPAKGHMPLFAMLNNDLRNRPQSPVRTIRYTARDGTEMSGVLTLPKGKGTKNLPLILMPHGGPFARDDEEWDWWVQFMASRGYAVLQPNYRGSSGFGTKFTQLGAGQWGLTMQDDLTDAVKWAAKEGIADPARVCIVGASYGGYAALRAAQRDKGIYRCAVSYAGVSDMAAMIRYDSQFLNGGRLKDYFRTQAPDFKSVSPINFAAAFSMPVLLMHGKMDQRVQVSQSREMAEKLKAAGATYRYVEQPLGDHHFTREADRLQFLQELETFLAKYNPA
jgi:acetyl esterase/lipase